MINCIYNKLVCMCSNNVPVSHCKDTYYFDKTNNYFKKVKGKGDQVSGLLCPKLSELLYYTGAPVASTHVDPVE